MTERIFIIKFGEIFLKSKQTQKKFLKFLKSSLQKKWIRKIQNRSSYLLVYGDIDVKEIINIFGVYSVEEIKRFDYRDDKIDDVFIEIRDFLVDTVDFTTKEAFTIDVRREHKVFPMISPDIKLKLAKLITEKTDKYLNYKKFDIKLFLRVVKNEIWVWTSLEASKWVWGLPYGIEWKTLIWFSGGIDSPVASYLLAKRGVAQDFLLLNIPWSEYLTYNVYDVYQSIREKYGIFGRFFVLDVRNLINNIKDNTPSGYRQMIFKTFLYKIMDNVSSSFSYNSFAVWENLWQVSTQTLTNMEILDKVSSKLILRPLLCYEKREIIDIAEELGSLSYSNKIKETCNIENHSNAHAKYAKIVDLQKNIDINIDELIKNGLYEFQYNEEERKKLYELRVESDEWREKIDLTDFRWDLELEINKKYVFVCPSSYNASYYAIRYSKLGYDVRFL